MKTISNTTDTHMGRPPGSSHPAAAAEAAHIRAPAA